MAFMVPAAIHFDVAADDVPDEITESGWYGYLTAPGYFDRTEYIGPFGSDDDAMEAICEEYQVDTDGEPLD